MIPEALLCGAVCAVGGDAVTRPLPEPDAGVQDTGQGVALSPLQLARALEPILGLRWRIETHRLGVLAEGPGGQRLLTQGRRVELDGRARWASRAEAIPALVSRMLDRGWPFGGPR